jgi:Bacterial membrane protein YfhO
MSGNVLAGLMTRARARPSLVAFGAYVVLGVIFFAPGLVPGHTISAADFLWSAAPWNSSIPTGIVRDSIHPLVVGSNRQLVDPTTLFEPYLQYTRSQLPHIPLWNPYIMGGTPYLGDMQSAIFSPFSLPAYILPFWWSLGVIAVMKVVVAAMGAFLLARVLGMRFAGAFLCGTVFGFGLFFIAWLPWPLGNVFPLIPWMLLATERLIRRPGPLAASGLAVVTALQFLGGHPETSVHVLLATVAFFILRVLQSPGGVVAAMGNAARAGRSRLAAFVATARRPAVTFVLALVLGTALAAVAIVPFLELLHNSSDLSSRPRSGVHVPAAYYFASFLPSYFPGGFVIETAFYAGALPLVLALVALLRAQLVRVVLALFALLCALVVLGIQPFFGIAGRLPGLDLTYLSRLTILYLLCIALLAGWGLDDLVRWRPQGSRAVAVTAIAISVLVLPVIVVFATGQSSLRFLGTAVKVAWSFAQAPASGSPHEEAIVRLAALVVWLTVAGVGLLLLGLRLGRKLSASVFAFLAIVLVVGDLFQAGSGENPAISEAHAVQPVTPAIRFLQKQEPARFVAVDPYIGVNPLPPDVNMRYGLYDARGYDLPVISTFSQVWVRYVAPPTPLLPLDTPAVPVLDLEFHPAALRILSLMGVTDILEQKAERPLQLPGVHVVYDGRDATIYANDNALPRTWLVSDQLVESDSATALTELGSADFHPRQVALTSRALPGLSTTPGGSAPAGQSSPGTAHLVHYGAQRVVIEARASRPSELVLSDTYYPGWQVTVNGRPTRLDRVDFMFRGVPVPAGTDRIVFTYDPSSFRIGWTISLGAVVVLVAAVALGLSRRRRIVRSRRASGGGDAVGHDLM